MKAKANYEEIAETYDKGHLLDEEHSRDRIKSIVAEIVEWAELRTGQKLLDLGCGTGRFALPFAYDFGLEVAGADASAAMLKKAQEKDIRNLCKWVEYDAEGTPIFENYFDAVFICHLLHHLSKPLIAIQNCNAMLKPGGVLIIRYGAWNQIKGDAVHTFFPEAVEIDRGRTPEAESVEDWLRESSFKDIVSRVQRQRTYDSQEALLKVLSLRETSVLTLISKSSLNTGLDRLRKHTELNPDDETLLYNMMTVTIASKPHVFGSIKKTKRIAESLLCIYQ